MGAGRVVFLAGPQRPPPRGPQTPGPQELHLTPHRAAYWPHASTLIVADLHLGKIDTLAAAGAVGVGPDLARRLLDEDFARLARALRDTAAQRLLIVGDLLHAALGLTPPLLDAVADFRDAHPIPWLLVRGNHDAKINRVADAWRLDVHDDLYTEAGLTFQHIPPLPPPAHLFTISGHEHPAVTLAGRAALGLAKLPAFVQGPNRLILPAFSRFTAGGRPRLLPGDRLFACSPHEVFEVPS